MYVFERFSFVITYLRSCLLWLGLLQNQGVCPSPEVLRSNWFSLLMPLPHGPEKLRLLVKDALNSLQYSRPKKKKKREMFTEI